MGAYAFINLSKKAFRMRRSSKLVSVLGISEKQVKGNCKKDLAWCYFVRSEDSKRAREKKKSMLNDK